MGLCWAGTARAFQAFNPLIQILRPISPIAWIPVAILWFGVSDAAPIFLIFLASVFPITVAAIAAVQNMQPVYLRAAQNFGLSRCELFHRVIFRASLPQIITGIRIALGVAWLVVVAAEMIAVNSGLGYLIIDARNAGKRYDLVVAGMVMIGLIGLVLDLLVRQLGEVRRSPLGIRQQAMRRTALALDRLRQCCPATAVRVRNLWMSFPGKRGEPIHVLENISLPKSQPASLFASSGRAGCGKSTLLNIVGGFIPPTRGEALVEGEPVTRPDPRRIFVFQENGVFPWLTVRRKHRLWSPGKNHEERNEIVAHYVEMVGLTRIRGCLSARAFRRHAAAGGNRPRPGGQSRHHLHGRAVRRARFHYPPENAGRPYAHLAEPRARPSSLSLTISRRPCNWPIAFSF